MSKSLRICAACIKAQRPCCTGPNNFLHRPLHSSNQFPLTLCRCAHVPHLGSYSADLSMPSSRRISPAGVTAKQRSCTDIDSCLYKLQRNHRLPGSSTCAKQAALCKPRTGCKWSSPSGGTERFRLGVVLSFLGHSMPTYLLSLACQDLSNTMSIKVKVDRTT